MLNALAVRNTVIIPRLLVDVLAQGAKACFKAVPLVVGGDATPATDRALSLTIDAHLVTVPVGPPGNCHLLFEAGAAAPFKRQSLKSGTMCKV